LAALKKLKDSKFTPVRTIHISFVPDEEIGGTDGMSILLRSSWFSALNIGLALDEGLANSDNTFSVFYGERLPWWIHVVADGNTGHGSRFIDGTAVEQIINISQRALEFRKEQKDILHGIGKHAGCSHSVARSKTLGDVTSLNLTVLRAGVVAGGSDAINVVPPTAEAKFDIRLSPHMNPTDMITRLNTWCSDVNSNTIGLPPDGGVSWKFIGDPLKCHSVTSLENTVNPWWNVFEDTIKNKCGVNVIPSVFPAATDSRFLRALGIKALGFSPIRNSPILLHEHDEYIDEHVFIEGCEVYVKLIRELASQQAFSNELI
jgi:aminoacylase